MLAVRLRHVPMEKHEISRILYQEAVHLSYVAIGLGQTQQYSWHDEPPQIAGSFMIRLANTNVEASRCVVYIVSGKDMP